jgi:hypothetical protein
MVTSMTLKRVWSFRYTTVLCVKVWRCGLRIGGYPGKYNPAIKAEMQIHPNYLFVDIHIFWRWCSIRNTIYYIWTLALLEKVGFIKFAPCCFVIEGDKIKDLEIIEIEKRA